MTLKKDKNIVRQLLFAETPTFQPAGHISTLVTEITADCFDSVQKPLITDENWNMDNLTKQFKKQIGDTKKVNLCVKLSIIDQAYTTVRTADKTRCRYPGFQ